MLDSAVFFAYKRALPHQAQAQVAQLVEQRTENPRVGGSNPPLGTTFLLDEYYFRGRQTP